MRQKKKLTKVDFMIKADLKFELQRKIQFFKEYRILLGEGKIRD